MNPFPIVIKPYGAFAVLIEWPPRVEESILDDILRFTEYLKNQRILNEGDWELVPAYNSLLVVNDKKQVEFKMMKSQIENWYASKDTVVLPQKYLWRLPVCYDEEFGIDLVEVSSTLRLSVGALIDLHVKQSYTVYGIGFLPGFMYLGGLPKALEVPRKATPRQKVQKGAVGLAGKQTGIYPQESPGGWNIIGNCPIPIFNVALKDPCFVNVGDRIQFYKISKAEYDLHRIEGEVGIYKMEKIKIDA
ncbi:5-oxoprolinase subunit PxpB [Flavobacteriaceae bacterium F89]|uniref:5-oxoprolinase subunit PxpB n=1 Tax=Cerina litoralis TaxID=2874477 RepID=A0AAE3JRV8_9FLAO|nr:5-oxoprolinase subunit PxpB [Cerina litoralis]MCG2461788.1 5-oxoprolinase subunit PxpB [Cerina litoralis]